MPEVKWDRRHDGLKMEGNTIHHNFMGLHQGNLCSHRLAVFSMLILAAKFAGGLLISVIGRPNHGPAGDVIEAQVLGNAGQFIKFLW